VKSSHSFGLGRFYDTYLSYLADVPIPTIRQSCPRPGNPADTPSTNCMIKHSRPPVSQSRAILVQPHHGAGPRCRGKVGKIDDDHFHRRR